MKKATATLSALLAIVAAGSVVGQQPEGGLGTGIIQTREIKDMPRGLQKLEFPHRLIEGSAIYDRPAGMDREPIIHLPTNWAEKFELAMAGESPEGTVLILRALKVTGVTIDGPYYFSVYRTFHKPPASRKAPSIEASKGVAREKNEFTDAMEAEVPTEDESKKDAAKTGEASKANPSPKSKDAPKNDPKKKSTKKAPKKAATVEDDGAAAGRPIPSPALAGPWEWDGNGAANGAKEVSVPLGKKDYEEYVMIIIRPRGTPAPSYRK